MNTITLKNDRGATIEVKRGLHEQILVRHSDFNPESFGEFVDFKDADLLNTLGKTGVTDSLLKAMQDMGGYVLFGEDERQVMSVADVEMIREAAGQLSPS